MDLPYFWAKSRTRYPRPKLASKGLAALAIRLGRKIRWDQATETGMGDQEANRLVNFPMRAPWHL